VRHRWTAAIAAFALALGLTACDVTEQYTFTVGTGADARDAAPGDGVCEATAGVGDCTLRAAVDEANALEAATPVEGPPRAFTIELATDVTLSRVGSNEDGNSTGDLDARADVTVLGNGHAVDAAQLDRAWHVHSGASQLTAVTVRNGLAGEGGGIRVEASGSLVLANATVADNRATAMGFCAPDPGGCIPITYAGGGGVWNAGSTVIVASTFSGNFASPDFFGSIPSCSGPWGPVCPVTFGGGVLSTGSLVVTGSTFSGDRAFSFLATGLDVGRGIHARIGPAEVSRSTFVDSVATVDTRLPVAGATVRGSILMGSSCGSVAVDGDLNLVQSAPCPLPAGSLGLGALADNGGPTLTVLPQAGSPALDAIPPGTPGLCEPGTDQRGEPRPAGAGCDIGAVERQPSDP
jgi:hypothetical protein